MLGEPLDTLESEKKRFYQAVHDQFGENISRNVFDKMSETLQQMQAADQAAKLREAEMTALTVRLRTLL